MEYELIDALKALEEIIAIEKEIEDYRFQNIGPYPVGAMPKKVKDEWLHNLDEFSKRKLKIWKKAKLVLLEITGKKY